MHRGELNAGNQARSFDCVMNATGYYGATDKHLLSLVLGSCRVACPFQVSRTHVRAVRTSVAELIEVCDSNRAISAMVRLGTDTKLHS